MRKVKANGRNRDARHVRRYHSLLESPAYQGLSPNARSLLEQLQMLEDGRNKGRIALSVRDAADRMGVADPRTAGQAFDELVEHGFIQATSAGSFSIKFRHARTWRLTFLPVPDKSGPTNEFRQWQPRPGSDADRRVTAWKNCNLRWQNLRNSVAQNVFQPAKAAKPAAKVEGPVTDNATAKLQNLGHPGVLHDTNFATHLQFAIRRTDPALSQRCKTIRADVLEYLSTAPYGSQGPLGASAGLTPSRFSRFVNDSADRKTLKAGELDRLEAALFKAREVRQQSRERPGALEGALAEELEPETRIASMGPTADEPERSCGP